MANVTATTFAIINMCEGVTAWVRRDGPLTSADVQNLSADLALRLVGATVGGAGNTGSARAPCSAPALVRPW
ncbi:MAG: hypothetical protein L0H59_16000, partial [Tomitella sp.]|nr:hypothetical protein [Tomitella sp.]